MQQILCGNKNGGFDFNIPLILKINKSFFAQRLVVHGKVFIKFLKILFSAE